MLCKLHSPQLPRELLADGKQHGHKLLFVSDNRNQFAKLENFREMFPFSRKEKQDDCFFFNNRNDEKVNFLLSIRGGNDSWQIKASKH